MERWGVFEIKLHGKQDGNPFKDEWIKGIFSSKSESKEVKGFYNGNGEYIIRFMPSFVEEYQYRIFGSCITKEQEGTFLVTKNSGNNHGPVIVANQYHFTYADETPYYPFGTTCYAWTHQMEEMQQQTIESLKQSPFNKIRFCIFPKHYDYNLYEPITYPYEGEPCSIEGLNKDNFETFLPSNPENKWDFTRFNPKHFEIIENRIKELQDIGIEADIILFHPYDRWGFSQMDTEADRFYLNYVIARFSAFRNVWWSLANEYDLCPAKTIEDWEGIAKTICVEDPYSRLRSIHNCHEIYDYTKDWITHCSIQRTEIHLSVANTKTWRERYKKPVVLDEVGYEGNINHFWGNLPAMEMVRLFWMTTVRGGYCGHGETYVHEQDKLWWSHGIKLYGESPSRIEFLRKIVEEVPSGGLEPANVRRWSDNAATASHPDYKDNYFLFYTGISCPAFLEFFMEENKNYLVEVIDTWEMTIEVRGIYSGKFRIDMPSKSYMAIRIQMVKETKRKSFDEVQKYYESSAFWRQDEKKKEWLSNTLQEAVDSSGFKIVVLDDDPTGVQSVHDISVFTDWSKESIEKGFLSQNQMFYLLTNSRGLTEKETIQIHTEIAQNTADISKKLGIAFLLISRGDSTLRGHFPLETETLRSVLEKTTDSKIDGEILIPFFQAGGRFTVENIHYVKYDNELIPAGETEFAKDKTFGYEHSDLCNYIEEKTKGAFRAEEVITISLEELRGLQLNEIEAKLMHTHDFQKIIVNALEIEDLKVFVIALYKAMKSGKKFLFRTAADFVKAIGNISDKPLLSGLEMMKPGSLHGGMIVVGSHTQKTTAQLNSLRDIKNLSFIEMNTDLVLEGKLEEEVWRVISICEELITKGSTPVVYTKRKLLVLEGDTKEKALLRSVEISNAVQRIVGDLKVEPSFIIAKGGITSSDVGVKALRVKEARVLGQAQPGVPVWKTDTESKFPGIPYIIFPGNVGNDDTLKKIVMELQKERGQAE